MLMLFTFSGGIYSRAVVAQCWLRCLLIGDGETELIASRLVEIGNGLVAPLGSDVGQNPDMLVGVHTFMDVEPNDAIGFGYAMMLKEIRNLSPR